MKRLLLMGGRPWLAGDGGRDFVETLFRYYPKAVKVGVCIFAQPQSDWDETFRTNQETFELYKGTRTVECRVMTHEAFAELSAWADVIYVPGGSTKTLLDELKSYDLAKMWDSKVIAGSSAGANLFCETFLSLQTKEFAAGLGWVPALCIPHWRDKFEDYTTKDWDWAEQTSLKRYPNMALLCVPEGKFVEYTVQ